MSDASFRRRLTRRNLLELGLGSAALSILAACQSAPAASPPASATAAAPQPATTAVAAAKPTQVQQAPAAATGSAGQVVVMQGVDANTLDPSFRNSTPEGNINGHIFARLTSRDAKSLKVTPEVVQEWKLVDDLTWDLKVQTGARFQDGTAVDAEAIAFSITRYAKKTIGGKPTIQGAFTNLTGFESAKPVDASTVRMKTTTPAAIVPDLFSSLEVIPPSLYADESEANLAKLATQAVGSGPYKLAEWVKDDHITLEVFDGYVGPKPGFQTVIIKPVPELSTRVLALQNGQADVIVNVAPDQAAVVDKSDKGRISKVSGGRNIFVGLRNDRPLLADKRVRQALNYAFNFDAVNRALLQGAGARTRTIINPPHEPADAKAYSFDLDKARSLMAAAGWTPGADGVLQKDGQKFALVMDSPSGRYIKDKEIAQAIQQDLQRLGVQVDLRVLDWSVYAGDMLNKRQPDDIFFLGLGSPFTGQEELNYIHKDFSLNSTYWQNDEYHALFDQLKASLDDAKRQDIMNKMWAIAYDDPPWIYVWHQVDFYGVSKRIVWDARADERIRMTEAKLA
jgi:peptide/nickel transport system substrate-binding protein